MVAVKEVPKDVFETYGLSDDEIQVYLTYMQQQQATPSQIAIGLNKDLHEIEQISAKLEGIQFLRKAPGIVERYIPTEPFLTMFIEEGKRFRGQVGTIKDGALAAQSEHYGRLDGIEMKNVGEVDTAVETQVSDFFTDSDNLDSDKKGVIDGASSRFTATTKQLEADLHEIIENNYAEFNTDTEQMETDAVQVWDDNAAKFNSDNDALNNELSEITSQHLESTNSLEITIHQMFDGLNAAIQEISAGFVSKFEAGITEGKDKINSIVDGMLADFAERVANLEMELKKDLDNYVDWHKENSHALTPTLQEILEKYLSRMNQVVEQFKKDFSSVLQEHQDHLRERTSALATNLKDRVEQRHSELADQVTNFQTNTVTLIDNLKDIADKLDDLSTILASRGAAWKALFLSKHKTYVALKDEVVERVSGLAGSMKDLFIASTTTYIEETGATSIALKGEIDDKCEEQFTTFKNESEVLDQRAQETVNVELEGLASDLSAEIDKTFRMNIEKAHETTTKLKDSLENSLHTHKDDYDHAIETHRSASLDHFSACDQETKDKNQQFLSDVDAQFSQRKVDTTSEKDRQNADVNEFLQKAQDKNNAHSAAFNSDTANTKEKQSTIYQNLLGKVRGDWDNSKSLESEKITTEIDTFTQECTDTDAKLHDLIEGHKGAYKSNATTLQQSLDTTIRDNIQSVKDAIADFTLQFMNTLDETRDTSEKYEEKQSAILNASMAYIEQVPVSTWHIIGTQAIIDCIRSAMDRTKSTVVIVTPTVTPEILEKLSEVAYQKKAARFMYTTSWDLATYSDIIARMKSFGNIQFRQLKGHGEYWACTRDAEEVILSPAAEKEEDMVGIVSTETGYSTLYSQFIGPVFLANSRPV